MSDEPETELPLARRPAKSESAFRTISEVSEELTVPQHVLRFWESKFSQLKPLKRGGGRRYYRPEDVALLLRIRDLLYKDGYTIRGAQKFLREQGRAGKEPEAVPQTQPASESTEAPAAVPSPTLPFDEPAPIAATTLQDEATEEEDQRPRFCVIPDPEDVAAEPHPGVTRLELEDLLAELLECKTLLAGARSAAKG